MDRSRLELAVIERRAKAQAFQYAALRVPVELSHNGCNVREELEALGRTCLREAEAADEQLANTCQPRRGEQP
jgi:hypothetical protein